MSEAPKLAEIQWTWRRVFALALLVQNNLLLLLLVWRVEDVRTLKLVAAGLLFLNALVTLLYMAGATTTDVMRLLVALKTGRIAKPSENTQ